MINLRVGILVDRTYADIYALSRATMSHAVIPVKAQGKVEDPFIWYQGNQFLALVKDFHGYFTGRGKHTVTLFTSADGVHWAPADHPFAFGLSLQWMDGERQRLLCLERPQLLIEDGKPTVLYCAAVTETDIEKENSFIVHIPLG